MSEQLSTRYVRLFEVRLLHHYWLDEGPTVFHKIADTSAREKRLLTYDRRTFISVVPSPATRKALADLGCIYRDSALGFVVVAPESLRLAGDTSFTFCLTVTDPKFFVYSALTLRRQEVVFAHDAHGLVVPYKSNQPLLSNLTGKRQNLGGQPVLFLSRAIPASTASDTAESVVRSGNSLQQLTSDNSNATTQKLSSSIADLPIYVHQADAPVVVPPEGVTGAPARGVRLNQDIDANCFAVISLTARRADDNAYSFTDADTNGKPKATPPIYEVHFKNRSTIWAYRDKATGTLLSEEPAPLPLTWFGNAGSKAKPTASMVKVVKTADRITQLRSEIFV